MATTNVTIRMDEELKKQAEDLFSDLGLNLTTAFVAFAKQAVREQRIPFTLSRNIPNEETLHAIGNVQKGVGLSKGFSSVTELMEDLNADD
ncbi:MAG: type II toxin-antitoxin system RelB/DinJ family antitoxin [Lacrimispora sp.]